MVATLGYWKTRGLGFPIRTILEYTGTKYEEKYYDAGPAPEFSYSAWLDVKFTLGLDFPNLPYYMDGNVKLTQSLAILRHIARKHDLCGKTEEEKMRVDMVEQQQVDLRKSFYATCYDKNFENIKEDFVSSCRKSVKLFSDFLGDNKWFAGNTLTYADFLMYDLLEINIYMIQDLLEDHRNLQTFMNRFEELEQIKKYLKSPQCIKTPLAGPKAKFGNKKM